MVNHDPVMTNIEKTLMTYSKAKEHGWLEAKQSGGAVYELGVKQSKHGKAIRRIAEPLMKNTGKIVLQICIGYTELPSTYSLDKRDQAIKMKAN